MSDSKKHAEALKARILAADEKIAKERAARLKKLPKAPKAPGKEKAPEVSFDLGPVGE